MKPKTITYYYEEVKTEDLSSLAQNHRLLKMEGYYVSKSKTRDRMDILKQPPLLISQDLSITFELK